MTLGIIKMILKEIKIDYIKWRWEGEGANFISFGKHNRTDRFVMDRHEIGRKTRGAASDQGSEGRT